MISIKRSKVDGIITVQRSRYIRLGKILVVNLPRCANLVNGKFCSLSANSVREQNDSSSSLAEMWLC